MIGLIFSVTVWYGLKDDTALLKNNNNVNQKWKGKTIELSPDATRHERWWRSPYRKRGNFEKNRNLGVSGARQNQVSVGPFTFNSINCKGWRMELEECRVLCELRMATQCVCKRLKEIACVINKLRGQNYRFIHTAPQVIQNVGNRNINDWSTMLVTIGIIVLVELLVSYQELGRLKCQIVGTLLVIGIPPSKGDGKWPRMENSREAPCSTGTEHYDAIMAGIICVLIGAVMVCVCLGCGLKTARKYKRTDGIYLQIVTERLSETAYLGECLMPIWAIVR